MCNNEKHINNFYKKFPECKDCNIERGVKRYYDNKDKISIQQKLYYGKAETNYYGNKTITETKEILKSYVESQNRIKAMEEK